MQHIPEAPSSAYLHLLLGRPSHCQESKEFTSNRSQRAGKPAFPKTQAPSVILRDTNKRIINAVNSLFLLDISRNTGPAKNNTR
jgi:hypothetical protein